VITADDPIYTMADTLDLLSVTAATQLGEVVVEATWRASRRPQYDGTFFVHVLNASGSTIGQIDQRPIAGGLPTSYWVPGLVLTETYRIPVDFDAGVPSRIAMGVYTLPDITRLSFVDRDGQRVPDDVAFLPVPTASP